MAKTTTRRRFLSIAATAGAVLSLPVLAREKSALNTSAWRGSALGAQAAMNLIHPDKALAQRAINACIAEIERLEAIFSLYRADSAVVRLNQTGYLENPPIELLEVLSFSKALAKQSNGTFDPTIQPLYTAYARHFAQKNANPAGPAPATIQAATKLINYQQLLLDSHAIRLQKKGAAITLNGVAQGFITDRIAHLLHRFGFRDLLIDIGEIHASGQRADGKSWTAKVVHPDNPQQGILEVSLGNRKGEQSALATSAGAGSPFDAHRRFHHLLNPVTGDSAHQFALVSVAAPTAMIADGLSTALSVADVQSRRNILAAWPQATAWGMDGEGQVTPMSI